MKCSKCQSENEKEYKFCLKCGEKLKLQCPQCGKTLPVLAEFCHECGQKLAEVAETEKALAQTEGERKHVTVLFSDLSGYTAMSEKLDPEEVKEITSGVFGEISQVINKYEGFVEKFVGDAVMAIFGVPMAHEDDPVRAIRAAREIHELVEGLSSEIEKKIGQPISMHTGINTGLVVTGEVDTKKGTHGVSGDTINLASRICSLAKAREILVGPDTYRQAEGHFSFESLGPTTVKGKSEPVKIHKVLSRKKKPTTIHRLSGLRADLVGRRAEITELREAVENLRKRKGRIFSIIGDAGTGKSRLVEEFKAACDLQEIQWVEGHAYAYAQNIPYFPMIDLLNRAFQIEEGNSPEKVRQKVESGVENLVGKKDDVIPYLGSLYSLNYPEIEEVSPEFWKSHLWDAGKMILSALAKRAPTIILLEDLHWADPSFVEFLRHTLLEIREPAIVLCVYRPTFSLFTTHQLKSIAKVYQELRLQDLSPSEAQDMMESLLDTENIPSDLRRIVQDKAEGNPFYLEELVNSLVETQTLIRDNGSWKVTKTITETDVSSTIHGVISGRLDRLEKETKRILQEASVIGRAFLYDILKRITELELDIDGFLRGLEQLDLIRTRSLQPDLEYVFKHALTQEVVYKGLLKKERKIIHERIALVIEHLFHERISEFYETLAFHFKRGQSIHKAVDYLVKSGEKSLGMYAVEESHQYYKEAFDLLSNNPGKTKEEEGCLIELLMKWALVFYYRGDFKGLVDMLKAHENLAESLDDKAMLGMFYAWLGFSLDMNGRVKDSYQCLRKALKIGEEIENQQVIGYACTWLTWTCADFGLLDEAIIYGERAQEISRFLESDNYLYFKSLGGLGYTYFRMGESKNLLNIGKELLEFGQRHSNIRSMVMGHGWISGSYVSNGDFSSGLEYGKKTFHIAADPFYSQNGLFVIGLMYLSNNQIQEAEKALKKVATFSQEFGDEILGAPARVFLGVVSIAKGNMGLGLKLLEEGQQVLLENGMQYWYAQSEYILGKVYLQIVQREGELNLSTVIKNIGFLIKNVPVANKKAKGHFNKAIELAKEMGAKGILGQACLDLGLLHKAKKRTELAQKSISEAIQIFEEIGAEIYLKEAKEALVSLG